MRLIVNGLIVISYAVIALATSVVLPTLTEGTDGVTAALAGAVIFIGFAFLHHLVAQRSDRAFLIGEMAELSVASRQGELELEAVRQKLADVAAGGVNGDPSASADIVAEMQVLQELIAKVAQKSEKGSKLSKPKRKSPAQASQAAEEPGESGAPAQDELSDTEIFNITKQALARNRVDLYLQPVVTLPQRKVSFYESFSRIRNDKGDVIMPEQYVGLAEREGLVSALDNLLLFRCIQAVRNFRRRNKNPGFFVNISEHTLHDRDFFPQFIEFMSENDDLADSLIFEFPQADLSTRTPEIEEDLDKLAGWGFRFSVDKVSDLDMDFRDLAERHFRFVRVAAGDLLELGRGGENGQDHGAFKKAIASHGLSLIVEKVEDETTMVNLLDFNADYGQGFLFGEPRPSRESSRPAS